MKLAIWNKKPVLKSTVEYLQKKFNMDMLTAAVFARRNITDGKDILFYMEDDMRFQHNPFMFNSMEDAVDRILQAVPDKDDEESQKEKVLIFGDKDVDGVTATTVLYDCLVSMGIDVRFKVPVGDDAYGLSMEAVDEFSAEYGSLIITVDCGIANNAEITHAAELGIDVIVVDHHNPQSVIPEEAIIINAKVPDSGYPFEEISGCAAVYKLVSALRFSKSRWYKTDVALLNAKAEGSAITIDCIKLKNLIPQSRMSETIVPGSKSISQSRLPKYLEGQLILTWDAKSNSTLLSQAFGYGAQFSMLDIQSEIASIYPQLCKLPLSQIKLKSKIAKYGNHEPTEIGGFYNIFVTYAGMELKKEHPEFIGAEEKDLQLVALAAVADVMPIVNENRLFMKNAINSINKGNIRKGLAELMAELNLTGKRITAKDFGWTLTPAINSAGRMGVASVAVDLFTSDDASYRENLAKKISELNLQRKEFTDQGENIARQQAKDSVSSYNGKMCVVYDERIFKGVSGILAGRFMSENKIPAITMTKVNNIICGSMRSCRGFDVTEMLEEMKDIFLSHGGHNFAAGFSLKEENLELFLSKLKDYSARINLEPEDHEIYVDAEIPAEKMTYDLLRICDIFEPSGNSSEPLLFMAKNLPIIQGMVMGKTERQHLKVTVDCGNTKWPCIMWGAGEKLHNEFDVGDKIDILFSIERNMFNGMETPQIMLSDIKISTGE